MRAGRRPAPAGSNRGRLASTSSSSSSSSATARRDQPDRAERVGPARVQGVRQPLDPLPRRPPLRRRRRPRPAGRRAWNVGELGEQRPDQRRASASRSPRTYTRAKPRSDSATGRSAPPSTRRGSGAARRRVIGSRSSSGRVTGGTSGVASVCGPTPTRTTPKSASVGRRSHSRWLSTVDHSRPGPDAGRTAPSRCCVAVSPDPPAQPGQVPQVVAAGRHHLGLLRRPDALPHEVASMPSEETPNMPPTT